jgi:hypothetical protein
MDCLQHGLVITRVLVGVSQREPCHGLVAAVKVYLEGALP